MPRQCINYVPPNSSSQLLTLGLAQMLPGQPLKGLAHGIRLVQLPSVGQLGRAEQHDTEQGRLVCMQPCAIRLKPSLGSLEGDELAGAVSEICPKVLGPLCKPAPEAQAPVQVMYGAVCTLQRFAHYPPIELARQLVYFPLLGSRDQSLSRPCSLLRLDPVRLQLGSLLGCHPLAHTGGAHPNSLRNGQQRRLKAVNVKTPPTAVTQQHDVLVLRRVANTAWKVCCYLAQRGVNGGVDVGQVAVSAVPGMLMQWLHLGASRLQAVA